jgi:tRNA(Ile)-lysidine synthase
MSRASGSLANGLIQRKKTGVDLVARMERNIADRALLRPGAAVLIGVSGGVDSMVLLHGFQKLAASNGYSLAVAHFNHQLRGAESDGDEEFVRNAADARRLPFHAGKGDVAGHARTARISIEMAARKLRHDFLLETARKLNCGAIALGHHADDQAETFWMRLLRGDAGIGLAGMRWKRSAGDQPVIELIRPMLSISRAEIESFATAEQIQFREDSSNSELLYQRNRLRHEVLPALEKYQPELRAISTRTAELLGAEKEFISGLAARWLSEPKEPFQTLHPALQREVIRLQLLALSVRPTFDLIDRLRLSTTIISHGLRLRRADSGIIEVESRESIEFSESARSIRLGVAGSVIFDSVEVAWDRATVRGPAASGTEYFDAAKIGHQIVLRHWQPGDRMHPAGANGTAKLQDLFTNLKVPASERRRRIVAVSEKGEIFWAEGLRISEEAKVTASTETILRWKWRRLPRDESKS